jgi:hypothetical protein
MARQSIGRRIAKQVEGDVIYEEAVLHLAEQRTSRAVTKGRILQAVGRSFVVAHRKMRTGGTHILRGCLRLNVPEALFDGVSMVAFGATDPFVRPWVNGVKAARTAMGRG